MGNDDVTGAGDPAAPAGWYPVDGGMQRYWDGRQWTEHMAPAPAPTPPPTQNPSTQNPSAQYPNGMPSAEQPTQVVPGDAPAPWVDGAPAGQPPGDQGPSIQPLAAQPQQPMNWAGGPSASDPVAPVAAPAMITPDDKSMAMLAHLLTLVAGFLGPLIIWLIKKDQSPYVDHHGKEALNFQISMFVYWLCALLAMIVLIGFLLIPVLLVLQVLFPIIAAVAANRGEYYRYPMTIRFIT